MESSSYDITIWPAIAIFRWFKLVFIVLSRSLNLSTSCKSTVDKEGIRPYSLTSNNSLFPSSKSNNSGTSFYRLSIFSKIISSGFFPSELPADLGWMDKITSKILLLSYY